jgi:predicted AAA+ superfamily ATPase
VASLVDFRRLLRAACLRIGNLVNQSELGRDVGLPQATVRRHLGLMEISYLAVSLPSYAVNRTKRIIKAPKLYWCDPALAMFLAGENEPRGAHLENLILADLLAWQGSLLDAADIMYWRTTTGEEVDFVVERGGALLPIEVKATRRPRLDDIRSLQLFRRQYPRTTRAGLLLHDGHDTTWLADGVLAAPWWSVI